MRVCPGIIDRNSKPQCTDCSKPLKPGQRRCTEHAAMQNREDTRRYEVEKRYPHHGNKKKDSRKRVWAEAVKLF